MGLGIAAGAALMVAATAAEAATMNFIGTWVNTTTYAAGNVVTYGNQTYYAVSSNLNSAPSPVNPAWKLLGTNGMDYKGSWVSTTTYRVGSVVRAGSQVFYSLQAANLGKNPVTETAYWTPIGTNGNTVRSGAGAPLPSVGVVGDFYIDTTARTLRGPKTPTGWPATATSLVGPQGPKGATGPQGAQGTVGPQGSAGLPGATGAQGSAGPQGAAGPTSYMLQSIQFFSVPATSATPAVMGQLTFTPTKTGKAIISGRGRCQYNASASTDYLTIGSASSAYDFQVRPDSWKDVLIDAPSAAAHTRSWSIESVIDVVASTQVTEYLYVLHESGTAAQTCVGTYKVEIYSGVLSP